MEGLANPELARAWCLRGTSALLPQASLGPLLPHACPHHPSSDLACSWQEVQLYEAPSERVPYLPHWLSSPLGLRLPRRASHTSLVAQQQAAAAPSQAPPPRARSVSAPEGAATSGTAGMPRALSAGKGLAAGAAVPALLPAGRDTCRGPGVQTYLSAVMLTPSVSDLPMFGGVPATGARAPV